MKTPKRSVDWAHAMIDRMAVVDPACSSDNDAARGVFLAQENWRHMRETLGPEGLAQLRRTGDLSRILREVASMHDACAAEFRRIANENADSKEHSE